MHSGEHLASTKQTEEEHLHKAELVLRVHALSYHRHSYIVAMVSADHSQSFVYPIDDPKWIQ